MKVRTLIAELQKHDPEANASLEIAELDVHGKHARSDIYNDIIDVTYDIRFERLLITALHRPGGRGAR